jgi:hypothetical protein
VTPNLDIAAAVTESRLRQGLPGRVEDQATLRSLARTLQPTPSSGRAGPSRTVPCVNRPRTERTPRNGRNRPMVERAAGERRRE